MTPTATAVQSAYRVIQETPSWKATMHPDNWISDELRHIKTSYHFFRQYVQSRDLDLVHVPGDLNCVNCLTKGYSKGTKTELNQKAASSIPPTRRPHLGQTKSSQHPI